MSMIYMYYQINNEALTKLINNTVENIGILYPDDDESNLVSYGIDKSWHLIHYLLHGDAWDSLNEKLNIVMGGIEFWAENFDHPPRYLRSDIVAQIDKELNSIDGEVLWSRFKKFAVKAAGVYPGHWEGSNEDKEYVVGYFNGLKRFVNKTSKMGRNLIICIE